MKQRAVYAWCFVLPAAVWAQAAGENLTIQQAVEKADKFPSIEAAREGVNAAAAAIRAARTNYLPGVYAAGQVNRATRNNVFGLLLPQSVIPGMSGPVLGTDNGASVWGSAAGMLVSWEPFDFGRRRATIEAAEATRNHAQLTVERVRFEVESNTAAAFLTVLAAEQSAQAARAAVDRAQVLVRSVKALVDAKLRAGADLSRADAELDASETQLLQAEQAVAVARVSLSELTGEDLKAVDLAPGPLFGEVPAGADVSVDVSNNPAAKEQAALIEESRQRLRILERSYRPVFELQASAYGRGSGALTNGATLGGWNGLAPNYFNIGAGLTVSFSALNIALLRAEEAQETAAGRAAEATYRQVVTGIQAQADTARATLMQARRIAQETPLEVADARTALQQASAQYRAGLAGIVPVAEAQRLVAQAEIDDSLARLAVWRAWLQVQIAAGDISRFITEASR